MMFVSPAFGCVGVCFFHTPFTTVPHQLLSRWVGRGGIFQIRFGNLEKIRRVEHSFWLQSNRSSQAPAMAFMDLLDVLLRAVRLVGFLVFAYKVLRPPPRLKRNGTRLR
jgi:hypothetical protein